MLQLPGTGKSFIADAVAGETSQSTFFSVSAADLISRYRGDSEKGMKSLFAVAKQRRPSIIFIDEVDSIMLARADEDSDGARRLKNQFLIEMDGILSKDSGVFIMAATNTPYSLDPAFLRRFDKLIYIPLPDAKARRDMFLKLLLNNDEDSPKDIHEEEIDELCRITEK